jgi:transposase
MKIDNIDVGKTIEDAKIFLAKEKGLSPEFRTIIQLILVLMQAMLTRLGLNSNNSSKPPSSDPNRNTSNKKKGASKRKPGGQAGRKGSQLKPIKDPDEVKTLKLDKRRLPKGNYKEAGYESRQVMDFTVSIHVTEYRAQILIDEKGNRFVADFPELVTRPIQYGPKTKASSVYMSQYQLIPYNRIKDHFSDQIGRNISTGSFFNFNKEACNLLTRFDAIAKEKLIASRRINVDETGININGKRLWLPTACNDKWTYFYPHKKRGSEAIDDIGIIPRFSGVICHDHWKPYYKYNCKHALCNAHHLRALEWSQSEDKQGWAQVLQKFLLKLNKKVDNAGGMLTKRQYDYYKKEYMKILNKADSECPRPKDERETGKRGRLKKSKSRNLLERLREYVDDVLRFVEDSDVPFTNNQGENDLRMTKVQQKVSGCFRSYEGALIFSRIRAYLITCRKHDLGATDALEMLFRGELPDFIG